MIITKEYEKLMEYNELPERFRAGDFGIFEYEGEILREFVDNFFEAVEENGYVNLEDFTEFMGFIQTLNGVDSDEVQNILFHAFMKSNQIQNALKKR